MRPLNVRGSVIDPASSLDLGGLVASQTMRLELDPKRPAGRKGKRALIIYVAPDISEELKALAHICGTSVQCLLSDLIEDYVARHDDPKKALQLAADIAAKKAGPLRSKSLPGVASFGVYVTPFNRQTLI